MDSKNTGKLTGQTEMAEKQSPLETKCPILPKNIVAFVGNSQVVLGQQYILVKTVKNDLPGVLTGDINRFNANIKNPKDSKSVMGNTNSTVSVSKSDSCQVTTKPISLPLDTNRIVKSLLSQKVVTMPHLESTGAVHTLITSRSNEVSLSQSQTLESPPALPLKKRSLLQSDKPQCLSQNTLLADKPFVPGPGNSKSTSQSASRLPTDPLILVSKPEKTKSVIDLNSLNIVTSQSNLREEVASSKPTTQGIPSFIVNLQENPGNLKKGPSKTPEVGNVSTKYLKLPLLSTYDKKILALKQGNAAVYQHQHGSPVLDVHRVGNKLKVVTPSASTILSGSGQSVVIGNIASLSPHTQAQFLTTTSQDVRKPFTAVNERGVGSVLNRPGRSLLSFPMPSNITKNTSVTKFSSQACPALKTILSSSVSSKPSSILGCSLPPTGFSSSSFPSTSTGRGNAAPLIRTVEEIEDDDSEMRQCSRNIINYYTSLENHDKGQQVMVMRPVLESDSDHDDNSVVTIQSQEADTKGNHTLSHISGNHSSTGTLQVDEQLHKTMADSYHQCSDSLLNLKIQSVYSLADSLPDFEGLGYDHNVENAFETEVCHISDSEDSETGDSQIEEETTFNLHEGEWIRACPPSFVVLERLTPQDIEDKRVGRTKFSVRCSHHCRMRTLSYLCDLNLLNCKNQSSFKDATSSEKTDICTTPPHDNDKVIKQNDSNMSPATDKKCTRETALPVCQDDKDKQNNQCEQSAPLCKDDHQNKTTDKIVNSRQALDTKVSSTSASKSDNFSLSSEKGESEKLEQDLLSLKRRIEEKRLKMKLQKTQRNLAAALSAIKKSNKSKMDGKKKNKAPALPKSQTKQNIEKLSAVPKPSRGSRKTSSSGKNPVKAQMSPSAPIPNIKAHPSPTKPPGAAMSPNVIPAYYVMNCSAPSLSNQFKGSAVSPQSSSESQPTASTLTLKNTQTLTLPKGKEDMPLNTVYSTLKSLSEHFKATGHVPTGSQYVMSRINNVPLVLKVSPKDLLPENLEALRKASQVTSSQVKMKESQRNESQLAKSTIQAYSALSSKPKSSQQTKQQQCSPVYLSQAEAVDFTQKVPSPKHKKTSAGEKSPLTSKSSKSTSNQSLSSTSPIVSSSNGISTLKNKQNTNVPSSTSVSSTVINSCQNKAYPSASNKSLCSLLPANLSTCRNISTLTHFPSTSSLLPERRPKRPTDFLSEEERAAKRRKLEQKYPLPPGVIIKCEPDTSEYDISSNWSVTSDIQTTGNDLNSSGTMDVEMSDWPMPVITQITSGRSYMNSDGNNESSETESADENIDDDNSPPHLDSIHSYQTDKRSCLSSSPIEIENDEEPPVLLPIPSTSFQQVTSGEKKISNEMSVTGSQLRTASVYDSGYDSVGPSSSAESLSLHSEQTSNKQPLTKMSKIQHLKEVLKMKQLQVENMLKKRSEIPEVDLDAL